MKKIAKLTLRKETLHGLEKPLLVPVAGGLNTDTTHPTGANTGSSNTSAFCSGTCAPAI